MLESNPERRYVVYKIASGGLFPPKLHFYSYYDLSPDFLVYKKSQRLETYF